MSHRWIDTVLADLHTYAKLNGLNELARQLDVTRVLARHEIARDAQETPEATPPAVVQLNRKLS